jgi:hypothetical protein
MQIEFRLFLITAHLIVKEVRSGVTLGNDSFGEFEMGHALVLGCSERMLMHAFGVALGYDMVRVGRFATIGVTE